MVCTYAEEWWWINWPKDVEDGAVRQEEESKTEKDDRMIQCADPGREQPEEEEEEERNFTKRLMTLNWNISKLKSLK